MLRPTLRLAEAARPVSKPEFLEALAQAWPGLETRRAKVPVRIGLAISGGVDSMALAALTRRYLLPIESYNLHAFIVDHRLRTGSGREAETVKSSLEELLRIPATILRAPARIDEEKANRYGIETYARVIRYRLLGAALRTAGIEKLLLAHHSDDQYELLLARLANGHRQGLKGMAASANFPRYSDRYGISESGRPEHFSALSSPYQEQNCVTGVEGGGLQVLRPLLSFSKESLRVTAEEHRMTWVEDETNKDPTLTERNAIRHSLGGHELPKALRKEPMLQLCKRVVARSSCNIEEANAFLDGCDVQLDIRSGMATLTVPDPISPSVEGDLKDFPSFDSSPATRTIRPVVGAIALHQIIQAITASASVVPIYKMRDAAKLIWPQQTDPTHLHVQGKVVETTERLEDDSVQTAHASTANSFTIGDVFVRKCLSIDANTNPSAARVSTPALWTFSRANLSRRDLAEDKTAKYSTIVLTVPPSEKFSSDDSTKANAPFELWDNRYWFSFHNPSPCNLKIRHLKEEDLAALKVRCRNEATQIFCNGIPQDTTMPFRMLTNLLHSCAPQKVRYTLPVLVYEARQYRKREDIVIGFPSLGIHFANREIHAEEGARNDDKTRFSLDHDNQYPWPEWVKDLSWEARYKKVRIGNRALKDVITPKNLWRDKGSLGLRSLSLSV